MNCLSSCLGWARPERFVQDLHRVQCAAIGAIVNLVSAACSGGHDQGVGRCPHGWEEDQFSDLPGNRVFALPIPKSARHPAATGRDQFDSLPIDELKHPPGRLLRRERLLVTMPMDQDLAVAHISEFILIINSPHSSLLLMKTKELAKNVLLKD